MNQAHLDFLASPAWATWLEKELVPWLRSAGDLGDDVLEVGPGPGLTTDLLRTLAGRVTAIELDPALASSLSERLAGTNVEVINADATESGLPSDRFSAAASFSMLHHIPDAAVQDRLFVELHRLLRPGGLLIAVDSRDLEAIRMFHEGDIFMPLDPDVLAEKLTSAGFTDVEVSTTDFEVRFRAKKPE
jgi:SAM-dependent methyltransferase